MTPGNRGSAACLVWCGVHTLTPSQSYATELLENVVVTARKIAEPRLHVPHSIDVIPADALPSAFALDLDRLAAMSPGLYFESLWGGTGSAPVLRGQSQPSTAGDNVGVFVDGVYQAERTAIDSNPIDLERVEIVRGPQSTMFGRSTFAGAIHYVPRLPSRELAAGFEAAVGTDAYSSANGYVSGPLRPGLLLGRIAVGYREADGTAVNAADGENLGGGERAAISVTLVSDWEGPWRARLSGRWTTASLEHSATSSVAGAAYNCGAIDAMTNLWSYYCGSLPTTDRYAISPGIPRSGLDVGQVSFVLQWSAHGLDFNSTTSYYNGSTDRYRDFDATATGELLGVCAQPACPRGSGPPQPTLREVNVEAISRSRASTTDWSQDFTLRGKTSASWSWLMGVSASVSQQSSLTAFGFERGDLLVTERLTAMLPLTPAVAGPVSRANSFLVQDPAREQVTQSSVETEVRTAALYGAFDYRIAEAWTLRAEARTSYERQELPGNLNSPQNFSDTTPRLSLQWAPAEASLLYVSAAKGSRSGGINVPVGLNADEQAFEPEYNWTYEMGARRDQAYWNADATIYYIDWRNTQLLGFPVTPDINTLITRNTVGVRTRGAEVAFGGQLSDRIALRAAYSHSASAFAPDSDDPGSAAFCGLKGSTTSSSFCAVGPPRSGNATPGSYVPYIDGNQLPRAPKDQFALNITGDLTRPAAEWTLNGALDLSYQGDVYDRAINGARFGERMLLSARLNWRRGRCTLQLWGTNLTDELYVRSVGSRGAAFYPVSPRPIDLVYGDGRRIGLTVRYEL